MPSEFELIETFTRAFPRPRGALGPGDDCAVVLRAAKNLCLTTDAVVEDVHFTRRHFSFEEIGHKALAVNLSDLAAMGATPTWFLCALAMPKVLAPAGPGLARGMSALARRHGISLLGGNFTRARELSITITAAGEVRRGAPMVRHGGRPGDLLYVSGTLGDARMGLSLLGRASASLSPSGKVRTPRGSGRTRGRPPLTLRLSKGELSGPLAPADLAFLTSRQKRPSPRVALGALARKFARAAIDLSDGLAQDLARVCQASQVGAVVLLEHLPRSGALRRASQSERAARQAALLGGEDYELLLAIPRRKVREFEGACRRARQSVTAIGELTLERRIALLDTDGRAVPFPGGYDHFGR